MVTFRFQKPPGLPLLSTNLILPEEWETFIPLIIYLIDFFFFLALRRPDEKSVGERSPVPCHTYTLPGTLYKGHRGFFLTYKLAMFYEGIGLVFSKHNFEFSSLFIQSHIDFDFIPIIEEP